MESKNFSTVSKSLSFEDQLESVEGYTIEHLWDQPAIYCGTYAKYNAGSLFGAWLDLRAFDSYEEFMEVCSQLHADEEDPEFMFQDYQEFPDEWYSESGIDEEVFNKIIRYCALDEHMRRVFQAYWEATGMDDFEECEQAYEGEYDSEEDYAEFIIDECYDLEKTMGSLAGYFDYKAFARDLFITDYIFQDGFVFRR